VARSAAEIATPSPANRMIAYPYTKFLNSIIQVDQAAAVIMTTTGAARRLGIPQSQWVYLHGGQDGHDHWYVSERADLADSPAIKECTHDALAQAGVTLDDIAFFDFYSCFPVVPRLSRYVLGISHDDPRPMTLTGGLPYFGGPGSNYVMHSIAEVVQRCRVSDGAFGMVTSNGWYCTKHGVGIYGTAEPKRAWSRTEPKRFQAHLQIGPALAVDERPTGTFTTESYTVWHDRQGVPEIGIVCGRTEAGLRAWAQTPAGDRDVLIAMMQAEWVGRTGRIADRVGSVNVVDFG
jgi:acetyl-CoA C-acetyltransferase